MSKRTNRIVLLLFIVVFLAGIPLMALFGVFSGGIRIESGKRALLVDIRGSMLDYQPHFSAGIVLARGEMTQTDILTAIDRASRDSRVEALVVRLFPSAAGAAKCEEIHDALQRFRSTGKRVITFSPVLANDHYLIACASDSIFMPPSGFLLMAGPASSAVFVRGLFDKLGIRPNIHRIEDYKSAAEMLTETERSPASREMTQWLLDDFAARFIETVAADRSVDGDTVRAWIDRALFGPQAAERHGIIDAVRYWDQITASLREGGFKLVEIREYMRSRGTFAPTAPRIAVVHAQGRIIMGESGIDPLEGLTMGSETIVRELRRARRDDRIDAVVLRVDSHGGDALAGEMISREVEITAREKPVVVSMSDVAASGGYEIAYRADRIVALPGSVTGSIGSIIGKLNMRGFYNRIGLTKDEMSFGERGLIYSDYRDFSPEEWKAIEREHWSFYRNWIADIARFRGMSVGAVDSIARGRVWTGVQAMERGLIDETGGLARAVEEACTLAGIADPSRAAVVHLPERLSLMQALLSSRFLEDTLDYAAYRFIRRSLDEREGLSLERELPGDIRMR